MQVINIFRKTALTIFLCYVNIFSMHALKFSQVNLSFWNICILNINKIEKEILVMTAWRATSYWVNPPSTPCRRCSRLPRNKRHIAAPDPLQQRFNSHYITCSLHMRVLLHRPNYRAALFFLSKTTFKKECSRRHVTHSPSRII